MKLLNSTARWILAFLASCLAMHCIGGSYHGSTCTRGLINTERRTVFVEQVLREYSTVFSTEL
jgi:hypothetical protein